MIPSLSSADFEHFFRAVRTSESRPTPDQLAAAPGPFPWQQRLVDELLNGSEPGRWPDLLDLPTGSGKTTTIDIALFVLACRDDVPRRIVFVVDRRVVVQQAARWAKCLVDQLIRALHEEADQVVELVARRLAAKSARSPGRNRGADDDAPIVAAELRGGIAADLSWARRPDVPTVITSTVDQVGSRLLMQGYGVSDSMKPVHAGLLANDVLLLLDEVHLSQPFAQTLHSVARYRERSNAVWPGSLNRWQVVQLSATPRDSERQDRAVQRFTLSEADRAGTLGQRLAARKPALVVAEGKARAADGRPAAATGHFLAGCAWDAAQRRGHPAVVAVVANRVAIATAVAADLVRKGAAMPEADRPRVALLTGRMRPYDRDKVLSEVLPMVCTGRDRAALPQHVFVVGTQSIEAGVDIDVDALVTQSASLDALKQRFGRVDRLGELTALGKPSSNVIVCGVPSRQVMPDPVYGEALTRTEEWLSAGAAIDFGIDQLSVDRDAEVLMSAEASHAPQLFPTHLNAWAQNPTPHFAPEVAAWLHGPDATADPDVTVVWRDHLVDRDRVFREAMLAAIPLRPDEAVDVPFSHVRRWLRHGPPADDLADVDGRGVAVGDRGSGEKPRRYLVVTPDGTVTGGRLPAIRPGDTVIVDGGEGGLTLGSWDPSGTTRVLDLSTVSRPNESNGTKNHPAMRLDLILAEIDSYARAVAERYPDDAARVRAWAGSCPALLVDPDVPAATPGDIVDWLAQMPSVLTAKDTSTGPELALLTAFKAMAEEPRGEGRWPFVMIDIPSESAGTVVFAPDSSTVSAPGSDRESSSMIGVAVGLVEHGEDTAQWAAAFLNALHFPRDEIAEHPVTIAGRYHDIGKADRRFQLQLREGLIGGRLLAKSAIPAEDWRRRRVAQVRSGLPRGARHELLSAAMLANSPVLDRPDGDLIAHLVASHHGRGRPFAPALRRADDVGPGDGDVLIGADSFKLAPHDMISVGSPIAEWFSDSLRDQGWFGNAWLTALLRLADHQASRYPTVDAEPADD